jgi:hypothetical protein
MLIELFEKLSVNQQPRGYIGCSVIEHPCNKYIWFSKHQGTTISFKQRRIFERGLMEEPRIIKLIKETGEFSIINEQHFVSKYPLEGHIDAIIENKNGNKYILEIKTMNEKNFKRLLKHKTAIAFPSYYAQCQCYMLLSDVHEAILLAVNKNTEEIHEEIINFNEEYATCLLAKSITIQEDIPSGFSKKQLECFYCGFKEKCQGEKQ